MEFKFYHFLLLILFSTAELVAGLYLLANFNSLFRRFIRNELIRRNLVVWLVSICFILAISPTSPEFSKNAMSGKVLHYYLIQVAAVTGMVLFVFNVTWYVSELRWVMNASFRKKMAIIMTTIISCTVLAGVPVNYFANGGNFNRIEFTLLFNFYTGCMTGLIYVTMSYVNLARQKKLDEKELELSKLQALKTKAELDALHSKINPHFLYNALNSIADLSITDGKKARKMTIALADLFRYSINYSNHNYTTVKDEVEMAEVYMQIEKVRFEDQLTYSVNVDPELNHFLVPRFVLQPIVENAVKHGLKATGKLTEIIIEVLRDGDGMLMIVKDNGPAFPDELSPGYGVKSIYDKLDLLFPGNYEIHFSNQPQKQVTIHIHKLMKDEPAI
jgi:two-component system, LytTR family, sensor kinase